MKKNISGVKGMRDLLPISTKLWCVAEKKIKKIFRVYGYEEIRTPIVEHTSIFERGIGEVTDIVEKEMYTFTDNLNGDSLTLRPENTASIVRASIEHNLVYNGPKKLWYYGPMFRHERPQRGRYRQFYQFGLEALGYDGVEIEAEQLFLTDRLWKSLGFSKNLMPTLEINCIGSKDERELYKDKIKDYFLKFKSDLDDDSIRRLGTNPLRILDSKNPKLKELIENCPKLDVFLGQKSKKHNEQLCELLFEKNLNFKTNHCLVRGLDYYNLTVFEWKHNSLGAQSTICAGGRYDSLTGLIGGKDMAAFGLAIGMERIMEIINENDFLTANSTLDLYIVHLGDTSLRKAIIFAEEVRNIGLSIKVDLTQSNIKTQMKRAGQSGAKFVAIFGDSELELGCVTIRPLTNDHAQNKLNQKSIPLETVEDFIMSSIKNTENNL